MRRNLDGSMDRRSCLNTAWPRELALLYTIKQALKILHLKQSEDQERRIRYLSRILQENEKTIFKHWAVKRAMTNKESEECQTVHGL